MLVVYVARVHSNIHNNNINNNNSNIIIVIIIIIISILDKCTALWGKPSNAMHVQMLWQP